MEVWDMITPLLELWVSGGRDFLIECDLSGASGRILNGLEDVVEARDEKPDLAFLSSPVTSGLRGQGGDLSDGGLGINLQPPFEAGLAFLQLVTVGFHSQVLLLLLSLGVVI